jgi:hypothetical protein
VIIIFGRLQPIVTTIATGAVYCGLALLLRPVPGGSINEDLADALTGKVAGVLPASLPILLAAIVIVWMLIRRAKFASYTLAGLLAAVGGLFLTFFTDTGEASLGSANSYTLFFDRRGSDWRGVAARRQGQCDRRDLRRIRVPLYRRSAVRVERRCAVAAAISGHDSSACCRDRRVRVVPGAQPSGVVSMSHTSATGRTTFVSGLTRRIDKPIAVAFACIVALLLVGGCFRATSRRRNTSCCN